MSGSVSVNTCRQFCLPIARRDSSAAIVKGWAAGVRFPAEARDFSLFHSFQTDSGAHQAFYPIGTALFSWGIKRPGREADHSAPNNAEDKNGGAIPPLPMRLHDVVLN
jgi:hypothetical protein